MDSSSYRNRYGASKSGQSTLGDGVPASAVFESELSFVDLGTPTVQINTQLLPMTGDAQQDPQASTSQVVVRDAEYFIVSDEDEERPRTSTCKRSV